MIEFKNVTKKFGDRTVLDQLNLKIPKNKITFIVGKSGEGKSVTIKHIMGLMRPNSGNILIDNEDITTLNEEGLREHRKKFGMLFQHAALFDSLTVEDNVMFPLREHEPKESLEHHKERAQKILAQVGLKNISQKFPNQLSTGEKKRVGLARALVGKPRVILYDEPTTGMDPIVSEMIDQLIVATGRQEKNLTSVVISHDLKAALATADYIAMLYLGKVSLFGTPEEFKKSKDPVVRQFFSGKVNGPMQFV